MEGEDSDDVPHPSLRLGDVDSPPGPYFISEVKVAIDDDATDGILYWAPYVTWENDGVDRFVVALVAVKVDQAQRAFANRATKLGYEVTKLKSGLAIDLRARPGARLHIDIDGYAADRGSFASIAPTPCSSRGRHASSERSRRTSSPTPG